MPSQELTARWTAPRSTFATTVYISASRFKLTLWPALAAGGLAWFLMWFSLFRVDWASQRLAGFKDDPLFVPIKDSSLHAP